MKKLIYLTFLLTSLQSSSILHSQSNCRNDITFYCHCKSSTPVVFPVQSVWVNGPDDSIPDFYEDGERNLKITLPMILDKPTLLSAESNTYVMAENFYPVYKEVRVKFSILEEGDRLIYLSDIFSLPPAEEYIPPDFCTSPLVPHGNITIPGPIPPDGYFTFSGQPGTRHIKIEIVDANGGSITDADPSNQIFTVECDVRASPKIYVTAVPLLFKDREFRYNADTFGPYSDWFTDIIINMYFFYDMLPLPKPNDNIFTQVISGGYARMYANKTSVEWGLLNEQQKLLQMQYDLRRIIDLGYLGVVVATVDNDPGFGYLSTLDSSSVTAGISFVKPSYSLMANSNVEKGFIIDWNIAGGGTMAHEFSHLNSLYNVQEEYDIDSNRAAYGYRVRTHQNKNAHFCYMGSTRPDDDRWIEKKDYKDLINILTNGSSNDNCFVNAFGQEVINISGEITRSNNSTKLLPFYNYFSDKIDIDTGITDGRYLIRIKNSTNQVLKQYGFNLGFKRSESSTLLDISLFSLNLPKTQNIKKIEICDSLGTSLAHRVISNNSPTINLQYPVSGQINGADSVYIGWDSSDPDGDTLYHAIRYSVQSNENGPIWLPVDIDIKGNHYNWRSIFIPNMNYKIKVYVTDGYNTAVDSSDGNFIIGTPSNITVAPQGFLNVSSNTLNMKDTARIYLRNNFTPYSIVDSEKTILDSLTLTGNLFFKYAPTGTYYVVAKHRNSIETWSKAGGETYTTGTAFNYDFTSAATRAYGNNLILKGTKFCLFNGDVNQDGIVDLSDLSLIDNDAYGFISGYVTTDLTGDDFVDLGDLSIADNNAINFVSKVTP